MLSSISISFEGYVFLAILAATVFLAIRYPRARKILAAGVGVLILVTVLSFVVKDYHHQTLETDKRVYSIGEDVKVTLTDVRLWRCCTESYGQRQFLQQTNSGWRELPQLPQRNLCLDGKPVLVPLVKLAPCDWSCLPYPLVEMTKTRHGTWRQKEYHYRYNVENCSDWSHSLPYYTAIPVPPGTYKVVVGEAEASFEIRESP